MWTLRRFSRENKSSVLTNLLKTFSLLKLLCLKKMKEMLLIVVATKLTVSTTQMVLLLVFLISLEDRAPLEAQVDRLRDNRKSQRK